MEDFVSITGRTYWILLAVLASARAMDILSTRVATPNLVLEGNPIFKKLGWRWGLPINALLCLLLAFWPLPTVVLSTTSLLIAARNFQSAWLMRSMGEEAYRDWHIARIQETQITLYLFCLGGNTILTAIVGAAVIYFSSLEIVPLGIGVGIIGYSGAVLFYTLLAIYRMRRAGLRFEQFRNNRTIPSKLGEAVKIANLGEICVTDNPEPQGK